VLYPPSVWLQLLIISPGLTPNTENSCTVFLRYANSGQRYSAAQKGSDGVWPHERSYLSSMASPNHCHYPPFVLIANYGDTCINAKVSYQYSVMHSPKRQKASGASRAKAEQSMAKESAEASLAGQSASDPGHNTREYTYQPVEQWGKHKKIRRKNTLMVDGQRIAHILTPTIGQYVAILPFLWSRSRIVAAPSKRD